MIEPFLSDSPQEAVLDTQPRVIQFGVHPAAFLRDGYFHNPRPLAADQQLCLHPSTCVHQQVVQQSINDSVAL